MFETEKQMIEISKERNKPLYQLVIDEESAQKHKTEQQIRAKLKEMLEVMEESSNEYLEKESNTKLGLISGFSSKLNEYSKKEKTYMGEMGVMAMATAFSTLETNSTMGKIVASPTAGAAGILPSAIYVAKKQYNLDEEELINGMLTAVGIGKMIGNYGSFAGAEGGCQAECGSAAAMSAAALTYWAGGTTQQIFNAASIAFINIMGLVCDPIAGLVELPCGYRNASGIINAMESADMALAGLYSVVPFEEVVGAVTYSGKCLPETLRETGLGGIAGTPTGLKLRKKYLNE